MLSSFKLEYHIGSFFQDHREGEKMKSIASTLNHHMGLVTVQMIERIRSPIVRF